MDIGRLYFGDNLNVLPRHIANNSVDLVYLDPPFNTRRIYNLLFEHKDGTKAAAQMKSFNDSWQWNEVSSREYEAVVAEGGDLSNTIRAFRVLLDGCDLLAYLTMMAPRLVQLRRVLKPTGTIYLHCDSLVSHYLKLLMDAIFGGDQFINEVIWKRSSAHSDAKQGRKAFGRVHDTLLVYGNSGETKWNTTYTEYSDDYVTKFYRHVEPGTGRRYRLGDLTGPGGAEKGNPKYEVMGVTRYWRYSKQRMNELIAEGRVVQTSPGAVPAYKRYLDEMPGVALQDVWTDIPPVSPQAKEKIGYATQKPLALLERIIETGSDPGDVVLDPFCGCGTAVDAAQKLGRRWIGIDCTELAIEVIRKRLADWYGSIDYYLGGEPGTIEEADALARLDKHEFQRWACEFIGAKNRSKKGADRGIDGTLDGTYEDGTGWRAIVSVKGGAMNVNQVRDLRGTIARENADVGVLVALKPPTRPMMREATDAGFTDTGHSRLQILTVAELFDGKRPDLPQRSDKRSGDRRLRAV